MLLLMCIVWAGILGVTRVVFFFCFANFQHCGVIVPLIRIKSRHYVITSISVRKHHCGNEMSYPLHTYLLTSWCRVLLEKLTGLQLVKFPAFYGTRRFITTLMSVRHLSLSWASPIQSTYPHPTSWRSILILSTHVRLGLPSGLFPSGFATKTLYAPLSSTIRATCPAHLILLAFITHTILGEEFPLHSE